MFNSFLNIQKRVLSSGFVKISANWSYDLISITCIFGVWCITCSVDSFGPKPLWCVILINHCSCKCDQGPIFTFNNSILLRCICCRYFMLDPNLITVFMYVGVVKLFTIITSNLLDLAIEFILSLLGKFLEYRCNFRFIMEKEHPRLSSSWRIPSLLFNGVDFSGL